MAVGIGITPETVKIRQYSRTTGFVVNCGWEVTGTLILALGGIRDAKIANCFDKASAGGVVIL